MTARVGALAVTIAALLYAEPGCTADYILTFDSGSARFVADQAGNATTLLAIASLLRDYGVSHGIEFVLVGELPAECSTASECPASLLLRQRVEAVTGHLMAQPAPGNLVAQLRWQPISPMTPHVEGLQLRTASTGKGPFSDRCPYQLEIADPRLPPQLEATGTQSWIAVQGPAAVPITANASIRVSSGTAQNARATITALASLKDHDVVLGSGSAQVQWSAMQLQWEADSADIIVQDSSQPRDISDVILPWDTQSSAPPIAAAQSGCHMRFVLAR